MLPSCLEELFQRRALCGLVWSQAGEGVSQHQCTHQKTRSERNDRSVLEAPGACHERGTGWSWGLSVSPQWDDHLNRSSSQLIVGRNEQLAA